MLRAAAFLRAAHAAASRSRSAPAAAGADGRGSRGSRQATIPILLHCRFPASAPFSSSSSSSDLPPPSIGQDQDPAPKQPRRRPSPRRGGRSSTSPSPFLPQSSTTTYVPVPHPLPLDLPSYRQRIAHAADPATALGLLDKMHRAGLSFDPEAALLALRLCTLLGGSTHHLRDGLRLLRRLTGATPPNSPIAHAAYALALAGCVRGSNNESASGVVASMRRQGVRPGVGIYQEVARACLEPKDDVGAWEGALAVFRAVLAMDPLYGEEGTEGGVGNGVEGRLSVRCRDEAEAAWVQALLAAVASKGPRVDVDAGLQLLATGLAAFAGDESTPTPSSTMHTATNASAPAFACNLVLAACIRAGRWPEATAVEELMRGVGVAPDAWAVNSLLARALREGGNDDKNKMGSKGLAASRLLQGLLAAHPTLAPSASAYRAVLEHGGCDALLDLLAAMQRIRGPGAVPPFAYRMLLRALDVKEEGKGEGRLLGEGLPLVAHEDA